MKHYLKITLLILPIIFYLAHSSSVQAFSPTGTVTIGFYYDNGRLLEMEDDGAWVFSIQPFTIPVSRTYSLYTAALYDAKNNLLTTVLVDQRDTSGVDTTAGGPLPLATNGTSGQVTITMPFDPILRRVVFKNEKGQTEADISIDPSYFCNFNSICESRFGENTNNCSQDCQPSPTFVPVSVQPSPSVTPPATRSKWKIFLPLVIWFGLAIGAGVAWFIIRRKNVSNF